MEEIIRRLTEITTRQHQLAEQLAACQERTEQTVEMLREAATARVPLPDPCASAHHHPTKLGDLDDIEAYLHTFEVVASRESWDRREWARLLAPFLTGEAQQAYFALTPPESEDYGVVQLEILARVGLSPICAAQQFWTWTYEENLPVRVQATRLSRIAHLWLLVDEPSAAQVAKRVVVDRLLRALPRWYRNPVGMPNPISLAELVEAV
ncbi:uncharacterized protein [Sinocyclocheilus grahami]|uniref:uncharacterized protein n=1 Tax=Sinocyclocheilus grahami TaxID=75366 RepID=UPI0007AC869C|nr:PREDICTED: uncharacterized protein LOC107600908 [Sinocyclocheilus grahami]